MPHRNKIQCPICDRKDVLNIVHHLKTIHSVNADDWLFKAKLFYLIIVYHGQPTITVEPTMIERSTTSIMAIKNIYHDSSNS